MNARLLRRLAGVVFAAGFVVLVATDTSLVHLLHASLLLALGVGAIVGRPRTG